MTIKARFEKLRQRLRTDTEKGSAAVEFAMVAAPFFMILMATIEVGVIFFAQSVLQNAVNDAARLVRTGQTGCFTKDASNNCQPMTVNQFRTQVCNEISTLMPSCSTPTSDLQFDVNAYPNGFTGVTNSSPLASDKSLPNMTAFNVGNPCDVVLIRAFYKWPVFTPGLSFMLGNMGGGKHLLATAAAFRNEPFNNNVAGC